MKLIIIFYDNEANELLRFDLGAYGLNVLPIPREGEDVTIIVEDNTLDAVCEQVHWEYNFNNRNVFINVSLTDTNKR